jgi:hypothetical protein
MSTEKAPEPISPPNDDGREPKVGGFVPEFVRKAAVAGLGALFLTEEGLRSLASQLKLPKEMLGYLASQAERTKDEVTRILGEEIRRFLQSEAVRAEWLRLLQGMTLEVKAELKLVPSPKDGPPKVSVGRLKTRSTHPKHRDGEEEPR